MVKRTLYFGSPLDLNIRLSQLVITNRETGTQNRVPVEDVGVVLFDHPELIYSHTVVQQLLHHGAAVIYCDAQHLPAGLLLPLEGHTLQAERYGYQLNATKPLVKQLWQQTIQAKIRTQALLLHHLHPHDGATRAAPLLRWINQVRSADAGGHEARAARHYWGHLFAEGLAPGFYRDRLGPPPNQLLNYGYAILRAAVARALVGSGLLPTRGIHHHNRYNAYALADDIMEPYRPWVDRTVVRLLLDPPPPDPPPRAPSADALVYAHPLSRAQKAALLGVLSEDVLLDDLRRPLLVALSYTTASLAACFAGEARDLHYPLFPPPAQP